MKSSAALEENIRARAEGLAEFFSGIIAVRTVIEERHRHHRQGTLFHVRVEASIPGEDIVISQESHEEHAHEDPYVAVRDAFDAAARRLEDRARRLHGQVKQHEVTTSRGRVKLVSPPEDYGFITTPDGRDVYFHRNSVVEGTFDAIDVGDEVRFTLHESDGAQGPHASGVRLKSHARHAVE